MSCCCQKLEYRSPSAPRLSCRLKGPRTPAKLCELSAALWNMKNIKDLKKAQPSESNLK